jgi:FMN phosphatase YigB (HAD superfamily)
VAAIFELLKEHDVPIGVASASPAAATATRLLRGFGLATHHEHIAPGKKDVHLKAIAKALGQPLERALFFDDLAHNIKTAEALGVGGCVLVHGGLCRDDVRKALRRLRERGRGAAMLRAWMGRAPGAAAPSQPPHSDQPKASEAGSSSRERVA